MGKNIIYQTLNYYSIKKKMRMIIGQKKINNVYLIFFLEMNKNDRTV